MNVITSLLAVILVSTGAVSAVGVVLVGAVRFYIWAAPRVWQARE